MNKKLYVYYIIVLETIDQKITNQNYIILAGNKSDSHYKMKKKKMKLK